MISVVVPTYNEGARVRQVAAHLREIGGFAEVVFADASDQRQSRSHLDGLEKSTGADGWVKVVRCDKIGRGAQMNAGAAQCRGAVLLFLHCDTRLPPDASAIVRAATARRTWGWFDLSLDAPGLPYRVIERMINLRARLSRIATGDQTFFIARKTFAAQLGFKAQPLMEDIEFSRRMKRVARPIVVRTKVRTSARRWQQNGVARTVWLMWKLRFWYYFGRSPARLATDYGHVR